MSKFCVVPAVAALLLMTAGCLPSRVASMSSKHRPREAEAPDPVKLPITEPVVQGGSIYDLDARGTSSFIADVKAHAKGDTVTVLINESLSNARATSTSTSRDQSTNAGVDQLFFPHIGTLGGVPAKVGFNSTRTAKGNGSISDTNVVNGQLAAQVTEVLPNGNLVLRGMKSLRVSGEIQTITLTGITRPESITSENQVNSYDIAEMRLQFQGTGPLSDAQKRTIPSRLSDFFNIF